MKWRSEVVLAVWLLGTMMPVRMLAAQQGPSVPAEPKVDPACACYVKEKPEEPGTDSLPGAPDGSGNRKWLIVGAAGLAVLSGIPFGGTTVQGLPFAAAPIAPDLPRPAVEVAQATIVPAAHSPAPAGAATPVALALAPKEAVPLPEMERAGMVPPNTATHLPLLAAAGVLMLGGGALLARKGARERRRRRRFVTL